MEYFIGFLVSVFCLIILNKTFKNITKKKFPVPVFTQSRKVSLVKDYLNNYFEEDQKEIERQSTNHLKKNSIKAFFWGKNVYWIENGFLVTAVLEDNGIDETTKKRVDTYNLNKVELDKMIFIVDKLTEGNKNDSSDSGK